MWIAKRRKELNLNQEQLAAKLQLLGIDVGRSAISHWENGKYQPPYNDVAFVRALAQALEVEPAFVLSQIGYGSIELKLSPYEKSLIDAVRSGNALEAIRLIIEHHPEAQNAT